MTSVSQAETYSAFNCAHTRKVKNIKAHAAERPRSLYTMQAHTQTGIHLLFFSHQIHHYRGEKIATQRKKEKKINHLWDSKRIYQILGRTRSGTAAHMGKPAFLLLSSWKNHTRMRKHKGHNNCVRC